MDGLTLLGEIKQRFSDLPVIIVTAEQLFGEGNELFDRKTAMPFIHRLRERVGDPGTYADQRCLRDAEL